MKLEDCIKLYKMMADRCAASGCAPNQARVYAEMVDFISACDSVEDSMNKIKNSPYYLAPSVALMQDKLEAWRHAAQENEMPEIVTAIDEKLAAIADDTAEIYVTGYEQTIQNVKNKYILTMQAFASIFDAYIGYITTGEQYNLDDIGKHLAELKKPFAEFKKLSNCSRFRELVPVNDEGYQLFVDAICEFINTGEIERDKFLDASTNSEDEVSQAWAEVQQQKAEIIAAGKQPQNAHTKRKGLQEMMAIAPAVNEADPSNTNGLNYTYTELDKSAKSASTQAPAQSGAQYSAQAPAQPKQKGKGLFARFKGGA